MKNYYYVQFNTESGNTLYISHYAKRIYTITQDRDRAIYFTNKRKAATQGKYFRDYVLNEKSTFTVLKDGFSWK